jgi:hypothetical protein
MELVCMHHPASYYIPETWLRHTTDNDSSRSTKLLRTVIGGIPQRSCSLASAQCRRQLDSVLCRVL